MVQFRPQAREIIAKVVYYGPPLGGKTTNLRTLYDGYPQEVRGELLVVPAGGDRTIFFDFLPVDAGTLRGMKVRVQLYTVPGQVHYNATRQVVLRGVDAIVFVADSQRELLRSNREAWENLKENLSLQGLSLADLPHVLQYNKRDLKDLLSVDDLDELLNEFNAPFFEAVANTGIGVEETLQGVVKLAARSLRDRFRLPAEEIQGFLEPMPPASLDEFPGAFSPTPATAPKQPGQSAPAPRPPAPPPSRPPAPRPVAAPPAPKPSVTPPIPPPPPRPVYSPPVPTFGLSSHNISLGAPTPSAPSAPPAVPVEPADALIFPFEAPAEAVEAPPEAPELLLEPLTPAAEAPAAPLDLFTIPPEPQAPAPPPPLPPAPAPPVLPPPPAPAFPAFGAGGEIFSGEGRAPAVTGRIYVGVPPLPAFEEPPMLLDPFEAAAEAQPGGGADVFAAPVADVGDAPAEAPAFEAGAPPLELEVETPFAVEPAVPLEAEAPPAVAPAILLTAEPEVEGPPLELEVETPFAVEPPAPLEAEAPPAAEPAITIAVEPALETEADAPPPAEARPFTASLSDEAGHALVQRVVPRALAQVGEVRELELEVPVPALWTGGKRLTLQFRLTLIPEEDSHAE